LKITACSAKEAFAAAISFMPNQAAMVAATMNGTQMKPAFCSHICFVSPPFTHSCESPPSAPNTPIVITRGTTNCMTETPRLPKPAFMPRAIPFCDFGKKKLMFAILEAKLPPPNPQRRASISIVI
jgi:hypothetical protein